MGSLKLKEIDHFVLKPVMDGQKNNILINTQLPDHKGIVVEDNVLCKQYQFGKYFIIFLNYTQSIDESLSIYFMDENTLLDSAITSEIGINDNPEHYEIIHSNQIIFTYPNSFKWKLTCFPKSRIGLHFSLLPYAFWLRKYTFKGWFEIQRCH